jgi:hypothetical protein
VHKVPIALQQLEHFLLSALANPIRPAATHGRVIAHLVRANLAPETGTGWARFMYEDKETLVSAGDCVHQRPGIRHYLFDYSPDMEYLEIVSPADFKSVDVEPVCEIPPPTPWSQPAAA